MSITTRIEQNKVLHVCVLILLFIAAIIIPAGLYIFLKSVVLNYALAIVFAAITLLIAIVSFSYICFMPKLLYDVIKNR